METNNSNQSSQNFPHPNLSISEVDAGYLRETRKWTKFLSIVGFVMSAIIMAIGVYIVLSMFVPEMHSGDVAMGLEFFGGILYFAVGLAYFFLSTYLLRFSDRINTAITLNDGNALTAAFLNQKSFYKLLGVFTICVVVSYAIVIFILLPTLL